MGGDNKRVLDRWLGIPLVFLLTLLRNIGRRWKPRAPVPPSRVLFIALSGAGTPVLADPAMKKAQDRFGAELFLVLFGKNRAAAGLLATVRPTRIFAFRENTVLLLALDVPRFFFWTRRHRIDTVVDLELFSRFSVLLGGLSGATNRVGFHRYLDEGLYRGDLLTHRVLFNPHIHIAKNYVALINSLLAKEVEVPYSKVAVADEEISLPAVGYHETELANMHEMVRRHFPAYERGRHRLVLIGPNFLDPLPLRRWPADRYAELCRRILTADPDLLALLLGTPEEHAEAAGLREVVGDDRCINIAGSIQPGQLPVLAAIAALLVTSDCGWLHCTSVTNLPAVVLYGPASARQFGSRGKCIAVDAGLACSPCLSAANHRTTPCRDNRCLHAISVDRVFASVHPLLLPAAGKDLVI